MELPARLKALYRHWGRHVALRDQPIRGVPAELAWFVEERMRIWEKKECGAVPPYTRDDVLASYRFCNIFRELDRQTIELHELLNPLRSDFPLWLLNMFYARLVARPETVHTAGLLSFDARENEGVYERLLALPRPKYGTPYVFPISAIQRSPWPTRERFLTLYLPRVMQNLAQEIETWRAMNVYDGVAGVLPLFGFNLSFLWTEVLIDTAYQYPERINLFGRFPVGPGAAPTFARIASCEDASLAAERLGEMHATTSLMYDGMQLSLSAENWEGIACEYRKYSNLKEGKGRKRRYA